MSNIGKPWADSKDKIVADLSADFQSISLEGLINEAVPDLREITFHSDGRVIVKTGASAKYPKRLYSAKTVKEALKKLIYENKETKED